MLQLLYKLGNRKRIVLVRGTGTNFKQSPGNMIARGSAVQHSSPLPQLHLAMLP
jgi:hypothetical protein